MALLAVMAISRLVLMAATWWVAVIRSEELPAGSAPTMFSSLIWHIQKASLLVWGRQETQKKSAPTMYSHLIWQPGHRLNNLLLLLYFLIPPIPM